MKFKMDSLTESLSNKYPYMLRNDGKIICVTDRTLTEIETVHPYIIQKWQEPSLRSLENLADYFFFGNGIASMHWFYKNTASEESKDVMDRVVSSLIHWQKEYLGNNYDKLISDKIKELLEHFWYLEDSFLSNEDIVHYYFLLNDAMNQEFCRVRFAGQYKNNGSDSIWFRVSSVGFNWFNLIWNVCYENRNQIRYVNICKDMMSLDTDDFYSINGEEIKDYLIDDFIMLKGNPVVESKSPILTRLQRGENLFEVIGREDGRGMGKHSHYLYIKECYNRGKLTL